MEFMMFVIMMLLIIVSIAVFVIWWKKFRYPVKVIIYEKRKDGYQKVLDKAKFFENKVTGKRSYRLKKKKIETKPIPLGFLTKNGVIQFYEPERKLMLPVKDFLLDIPELNKKLKIEMAKGDVIVTDEDRFWLANQIHEARYKYGTMKWWQEYLPIVTVLVCGILLVIMMAVILQNIVEVLKAMENNMVVMKDLIEATKGMAPPPV